MIRGSDSAGSALGALRTLYERGPLGGRADADLLALYLGRDRREAEDAFAVIVRRHGPAVLAVCRGLLPGRPEAEDAFQAAFLVLARRAGAIRRPEALGPWLRGVAGRTAREARRRAARLRAREGGTMTEPLARDAPKAPDDRLAALAEEVDRLPERLRAPLVLCELDGLSRKEAADRLGLAEGTLSSRLARGRARLKDRLERRGLAPSAGAIASAVRPPLPESLAESTARLALDFAASGEAAARVPAALRSLAEGVLSMMALSRLKLAIASVFALGAAAGFALASAPTAPRAPDGPPAAEAKAGAPDDATPDAPVARVEVVDEAGAPVAGAEVRAGASTPREVRGRTGPDGRLALPLRADRLDGTTLLASSPDGLRLGTHRYGYPLTDEQRRAPVRIVLKPAREVTVRVTDATGAPIADATVEAAGQVYLIAEARTAADGSARLRVPPDAPVQWIYALKGGRGFDYAEFARLNELNQPLGGTPAADLPAEIPLSLDGARTVKIRAVGTDGAPLPGTGVRIWLLSRPGHRSQVNAPSLAFQATTDADGVATFDWLPPDQKGALQFWPTSERFDGRRVVVEEGQSGPVQATLARLGTIRGHVRNADGSPAPGVPVEAYGSGRGLDHGRGRATSGADGSYAMDVAPGEAYAIWVDDPDRAAPSRFGVVVQEGLAVGDVDFALAPGTVLKGRVTIGDRRAPAPRQHFWLSQEGGRAPEELRVPGDTFYRAARRQIDVFTDADGRYSVRLGPGEYSLIGPMRTETEKLTVAAEPEIVRDFAMPRPERGPLTGRVVLASDPTAGVPGARVEIVPRSSRGYGFTVTADAEGRFQAERFLDPTVIHARDLGGAFATVVEIGSEDREVLLPIGPTASASGLLLDENGDPAANQELHWGRRVYLDAGRRVSSDYFHPKVVTDEAGRFTLPELVVGQPYHFTVRRGDTFPATGMIRPERPGPIALGTIRVGAYQGPPEVFAATEPAFREGAMEVGAPAPALEVTGLNGHPVKLADLRGKTVLIAFWASWCEPSTEGWTRLRALGDTFARDDRLAILGVSLDDAVAAPTAFARGADLPGTQAHLKGGWYGAGAEALGLNALPAFALIGPDGSVLARGRGGEAMEAAVKKALGPPR